MKKNCKNCGIPFQSKDPSKYCDECKKVGSEVFIGKVYDNRIPQVCASCGKSYLRNRKTKYCTDDCRLECSRKKWRLKRRKPYNQNLKTICKTCGKSFSAKTKGKTFCSEWCTKMNRRSNGSLLVAKKECKCNKKDIEYVNLYEVFEQDNWICGICGEKVDRTLKYPDLWSLTADHIIPISKGGTHTKENIQTAHQICNSIKWDNLNFKKENEEALCLHLQNHFQY